LSIQKSQGWKEISMAIYRALGTALVPEREYREALGRRTLHEVSESVRSRAPKGRVEFENGVLDAASLPAVEFEPVGFGKPLTVMIRNIYTGQHPRSAFGKSRDMLAMSAMKGLGVYNAAPRAVNFLKKDVTRTSSIQFAGAAEEGTPLVYYSPALTQPDSVVTVEVVFDEFPKESMDKVGGAFSSLAGVPMFAPYSGVLLAAGLLIKLVGKIGEAIVDGDPAFRSTEPITFTLPGQPAAIADFRLMTEEDLDPSVLRDYELRGNKLVKVGSDQEYRGQTPYVVLSLDGRKNDAYASFVPTAATAVLLERFYRTQSGGSTAIDALIEGVKLYNDVRFRRQADAVKKEIDGMPNGDEKSKKSEEYNALVRNILSDELKLKEV
jgi:hypothetical protein